MKNYTTNKSERQPLLRVGYFYRIPEPENIIVELYHYDDPECIPITAPSNYQDYKLLFSEGYTHEYCAKHGIDLSEPWAIQPCYSP